MAKLLLAFDLLTLGYVRERRISNFLGRHLSFKLMHIMQGVLNMFLKKLRFWKLFASIVFVTMIFLAQVGLFSPTALAAATSTNQSQIVALPAHHHPGSQPQIHETVCGVPDPNYPDAVWVAFYWQSFDDQNFDPSLQICFQGIGSIDLDDYTWNGRLWGQNVSAINMGASGFVSDEHYNELSFSPGTQIGNLTHVRGCNWNDRVRFVTVYAS